MCILVLIWFGFGAWIVHWTMRGEGSIHPLTWALAVALVPAWALYAVFEIMIEELLEVLK